MRTLSADGGTVSEALITVNSTMIAPPGTIWMVENTGEAEDLKVLVVIGCHQPGIDFFDSWATANISKPALVAHVMPWNTQCPHPLNNSQITVLM